MRCGGGGVAGGQSPLLRKFSEFWHENE